MDKELLLYWLHQEYMVAFENHDHIRKNALMDVTSAINSGAFNKRKEKCNRIGRIPKI